MRERPGERIDLRLRSLVGQRRSAATLELLRPDAKLLHRPDEYLGEPAVIDHQVSALARDDELGEYGLHLLGDHAGLRLAAAPGELRQRRVLPPAPRDATDPPDAGQRALRARHPAGHPMRKPLLPEQVEPERLDLALQARVGRVAGGRRLIDAAVHEDDLWTAVCRTAILGAQLEARPRPATRSPATA